MSTANYDILQHSDLQQLKQYHHPKPSLPPSNIDSKAPRSERIQGPNFLETEVDKYDIGLYINKVDTMSDDDKFMLISNVGTHHRILYIQRPMADDLIQIGSKYLLGGCAIQNTLMEHYVWHMYFVEYFVTQKVSCNNYVLNH